MLIVKLIILLQNQNQSLQVDAVYQIKNFPHKIPKLIPPKHPFICERLLRLVMHRCCMRARATAVS
jgi:hypothetical protein